jgi:asparagine synthase (glutamine-hydrolysing)
MIETVRHRGPDAGEVWVEAAGGVALGQRRLAIIDVSPGSAHPMHSADRRYVITFNGEIYNYRDIRRELLAAGRPMRSESDTEVLLETCALWGVEAAIERAVGMFAFALSDRKTRSLILARDRLGIKPLYYAAMPGRVIFASQLKAFRATPDWKPTIDEDAVVGYLRHAYIFLAWAKRSDLSYPPELEAAVTARGVQVADWKKLFDGLRARYDQNNGNGPKSSPKRTPPSSVWLHG